jgi:hypothetical protein
MKKDAYYFPHFSNARNDSKLLKLRRILGIEGYGIYFMLLEILREQTDFKLPLKIVDELEFDLRVSKEKILTVITNYELFDVDSEFFFSPKMVLYLQPYIEKSERARLAAGLRWNKIKCLDANADANALQMQNKSNTNADASKVNKSKVKKSKVFTPPTIEDVKRYFKDNGYSENSGSTAFYYYDSANWVDSKGNKIKNWKQKMIGVWFKEENKEPKANLLNGNKMVY